MVIEIKIEPEHIKIISTFRYKRLSDNEIGIDLLEPYLINNVDNIAILLGYGKKSDYDNNEYPVDISNKIWELHDFIIENILYIETIIHQFIEDGLKVGTYRCKDNDMIWTYKK